MDQSVGFLNLPIVKHLSRTRNLRPALKAWVQRTPGRKIVIAYSLNSTFMKCLSYLQSLGEQVVTCVVVPDLPEYMNTSTTESVAYRLLKRIDKVSIRRNFGAADSLVLLTESMRERLPPGAPHIVMEGIGSPVDTAPRLAVPRSSSRVILYAGTLNARYGIAHLLEEFRSVKDSTISLIICGGGDSEHLVREAAAVDDRIRFMGRVSHSEVLELQRQATILVNPRRNDEEFAKYSFPSKILEYMSVGRPIIAYELDGMPREYRNYIAYVPREDGASLARTIQELCNLSDDELDSMGARARQFVHENKNPYVQARRILNLVNSHNE